MKFEIWDLEFENCIFSNKEYCIKILNTGNAYKILVLDFEN